MKPKHKRKTNIIALRVDTKLNKRFQRYCERNGVRKSGVLRGYIMKLLKGEEDIDMDT